MPVYTTTLLFYYILINGIELIQVDTYRNINITNKTRISTILKSNIFSCQKKQINYALVLLFTNAQNQKTVPKSNHDTSQVQKCFFIGFKT